MHKDNVVNPNSEEIFLTQTSCPICRMFYQCKYSTGIDVLLSVEHGCSFLSFFFSFCSRTPSQPQRLKANFHFTPRRFSDPRRMNVAANKSIKSSIKTRVAPYHYNCRKTRGGKERIWRRVRVGQQERGIWMWINGRRQDRGSRIWRYMSIF